MPSTGILPVRNLNPAPPDLLWRTDLQKLGQALKIGDLAGARQAVTALSGLGFTGSSSTTDPFHNSLAIQNFFAIGKALRFGDLGGARQAFAALEADAQTLSSARVQYRDGGRGRRASALVLPEAAPTGGDAGNISTGPAANLLHTKPVTTKAGNVSAPELVTVHIPANNNSGSAAAPPSTLNLSGGQGSATPEIVLHLSNAGNGTQPPAGVRINFLA